MSTRRHPGYDLIIPVVDTIAVSEMQYIIKKTADFSIVDFNWRYLLYLCIKRSGSADCFVMFHVVRILLTNVFGTI